MHEKNVLIKKGKELTKRPAEYQELFASISALIEEGRKAAVRQINTTLIATYWMIGMRIVEFEQGGKERAAYGEEILQNLAQELTKRYGNGFGFTQLKTVRQFYLTYRQDGFKPSIQMALQKGHTLCGQFPYLLREINAYFTLSWSHYRLLIRIEEPEKRAFYNALSVQNHWSVRQLDREINALLYERTALSKRKDLVLARANENPIVAKPEDEVKDSYVLDFLGLKKDYAESDLEDALIRHLENFLLELGRGFAFMARQKRFAVDGDEYRIDLLLYNILLKAYIVLELKLTKFTHSHAGQTNFYVNWVKENVLPKAENDPIGIILCSDKNNTTVRYATGGLNNKIFVSKYQLQLPKPEELEREIERGKQLFLQNHVNREAGLGHQAQEKQEKER
ncbi:MAG TPA: PDDEXK nuclease domain-containing protein [Candidatus Omnitrophota bacterium]|nr:PDDEXK nuclease domain-containing protein [Candidatus Omnitrophota bacterium]